MISPFGRQDGRNQRLEVAVNEKDAALGSTPIINLFRMTAEPIWWIRTQLSVSGLCPHARRRQTHGIYYVDEVVKPDQRRMKR